MVAGKLGIIHDIDKQSTRFSGLCDRAVDGRVVGGGHHQPCIIKPMTLKMASNKFNIAVFECGLQMRMQCHRTDSYPGARGSQRRYFPDRNLAATHNQHQALAQVGKQGKQGACHGSFRCADRIHATSR